MTDKRINIRFSAEELLKVKERAESVGITPTEFARLAALNFGKNQSNADELAAAAGAIMERIDALDSRLESMAGAQQMQPTGQHAEAPGMDGFRESIGDLYAQQERVEALVHRQDETLFNITTALGKILDHLAHQSAKPAPQTTASRWPDDLSAATTPAPIPAQQEPKAAGYKRCLPGSMFNEFRESEEVPRPERQEYYRRELAKFVERNGWDSKVTPEQYGWANLTPPADLYA